MNELDDKLYSRILKLCALGEEYIDIKKYQEAIVQFEEAFKLLPAPKSAWEAGSWILSAIGDCYFIMENYTDAVNFFKHSETYPKGIESGFAQLRIGQSFYELGNISQAKEYLLRAYLLAGIEIFSEENEKYKDLLDLK